MTRSVRRLPEFGIRGGPAVNGREAPVRSARRLHELDVRSDPAANGRETPTRPARMPPIRAPASAQAAASRPRR